MKIRGEAALADEDATREFPKMFLETITLRGYEAHQVFNADETKLIWKKMPTRIYVTKKTKVCERF